MCDKIFLIKKLNLLLYFDFIIITTNQMELKILGKLHNISNNELDLDYENLIDVPDEIFTLVNLEILNLSCNELTMIPDSISVLTNLQELNLRSNYLTSLPESMCNLTNLLELNLCSNDLVKLPDSLDKLLKLKTLILYDNKLCSLPKSILKIKNISAKRNTLNQVLCIDESSYQLDNLDHSCDFLILNRLTKPLENLPCGLQEIWLHRSIKNPQIKLPFGCKIKPYEFL